MSYVSLYRILHPFKKTALLFLFVLFAGLTTDSYGQIYVDDDATGTNNGTSWTDAYTDLQDALAVAGGSDVIVIAKGTYTPGAVRDNSFTITGNQDGLKIYGGWAGTETFADAADVEAQLDSRNLAANPTILSGDIGSDDITNDGITETTADIRGDNSFHVLVFNAGGAFLRLPDIDANITTSTILDGVTVTGGNADGSSEDGDGGGLYCDGGFEGNECSPTIKNVRFSGNFAGDFGGAMFYMSIFDGISNPLMVNTTFSGNFARRGGAIYNHSRDGTSSQVISNAIFSGNAANEQGGAILNRESSPVITNSIFTNNTALNGGAIYNFPGFDGTSNPLLTNTILWGNEADQEGDEIFNEGNAASSRLTHTLIEGGLNGSGVGGSGSNIDNGNNFSADPRFQRGDLPSGGNGLFGTADDGLRLLEGSPALDVGVNDSVTVSADLAGAPRIQDGTVDLGAYEGGAQPQIYVDIDAPSGGDGSSWASAFNDLQDALAVAGGGNEIWVAEGIYMPGTGQGDSFTITGVQDGLQLLGGFSGTETDRSQRNSRKHRTILSGDIGGDDTDPDGDGIIKDANDIIGGNSHHVLMLDGRSSSQGGQGPVTEVTVIDGFTVTAGQANGSGSDERGGGLFCDGRGNSGECSPHLQKLIFSGNYTKELGGGIFNNADDRGTSSPTIIASVFIGNRAGRFGGGAIAIRNILKGTSNTVIKNTIFTDNSASSEDGGAIRNISADGVSHITLTNVTFAGNSAAVDGGAIYNGAQEVDEATSARLTLTNVIFYDNIADVNADGTGSGNQIANEVLGADPTTVEATLTLTLLQGGTSGVADINGASTTYLDGSGNPVSFANSTNIDADPQFFAAGLPAGNDQQLGTDDDGLYLLPGSPALNVGTNDSVTVSTDLAGNSRIQDGTVDLGAYEGAFMNPQQLTITGSEGWRMLTAPADGMSYAELLDPLWLQGMSGGDAANGTPNLYTWDEPSQQFEAVTDASQAPGSGQGFIAFVYDDQDYDGTPESFPKTLTLDQARTGGAIAPTLSYTDGGTPNDGFNLVGNPYGMTIDWDDPDFTKTNLAAPMYIWNAAAGEYQSWNGSVGTLPNEGLIAPWQGFWVQASGASPALEFSEDVRSTGGTYYKQSRQAESTTKVPQITFALSSGESSSSAVMMFSEGALAGTDSLDAWKLEPLGEQPLSLYTTSVGGHALDINVLPKALESPLELSLDFQGGRAGETYTLSWDPEALPELANLILKDTHANKSFDLGQAGEYSFKVTQTETKQKSVKKPSFAKDNSGEVKGELERPVHGPSPSVLKAKSAAPRFVLKASPMSTGIEPAAVPQELQLSPNYPNPFNPTTTIRYGLPETGRVELTVFSTLGRRVQTLVSERKTAGRYEIQFNASNLSSGVYFYRLETPVGSKIQKMTLIK